MPTVSHYGESFWIRCSCYAKIYVYYTFCPRLTFYDIFFLLCSILRPSLSVLLLVTATTLSTVEDLIAIISTSLEWQLCYQSSSWEQSTSGCRASEKSLSLSLSPLSMEFRTAKYSGYDLMLVVYWHHNRQKIYCMLTSTPTYTCCVWYFSELGDIMWLMLWD